MQARIRRSILPFEGGWTVLRRHRAQWTREEPAACRLLVLFE